MDFFFVSNRKRFTAKRRMYYIQMSLFRLQVLFVTSLHIQTRFGCLSMNSKYWICFANYNDKESCPNLYVTQLVLCCRRSQEDLTTTSATLAKKYRQIISNHKNMNLYFAARYCSSSLNTLSKLLVENISAAETSP